MIKQTLLSSTMLAIMMIIFYSAAGRTNIPRSWYFFAVAFIYFLSSNIVLYKYNPNLLIQRLIIRRKGSKKWDEVLVRVSNLTALLLMPLITGLDVGRYGWSNLGQFYAFLGYVSLVVSSVLINWAMVVNPFFEPTVRIQEEREHKVVSSGPYAFVRHPGYLSGILWVGSIPLILGSLYGFFPFLLYSVFMILRTYLEDETLLEELSEYREYAEKVRYRLFPGLW
ncbi:isoprenylcysteine carboxylmethyltransferase family protein [Candidatus Bathyarchaeota archaeon]|nr:isoprenylcysteine carboxylmethyltransferase family protein [Candidatus Bathyarchaeota archaeon]